MKLSQIERLILSNQFRILEKLYPDEGYETFRTIVEKGYTYNYNDLVEWLYDEMSEQDCEEVWDILQLHRELKISFDDLADKAGIEESDISFWGFDGNNETRFLSYARFIIEDMDRYRELKKEHGDYNSHAPMLHRYRPMVDKWKSLAKRHEPLTADQIKQILNAPNSGS